MGAIQQVLLASDPRAVVSNYKVNATTPISAGIATWSSVSYGSPLAPDRNIFVCVNTVHTSVSTGCNISSLTIDGITATKLAEVLGSAGDTGLTSIFVASVPTGSSGNIVATYGTPAFSLTADIFVYEAYNVQSLTPVFTGTSNSASGTVQTVSSVVFPANGLVIGSAMFRSSSGDQDIVWANLTERDETFRTGGSIPVNQGTASATQTTASTANVTATMANIGINEISMAVVSMR